MPLNGITLGQRKTDSNNWLIIISEKTKHTLGGKYQFGICQMIYFWSELPNWYYPGFHYAVPTVLGNYKRITGSVNVRKNL